MEKQLTRAQTENAGTPDEVEVTENMGAHEVAQRGHHVLELSKELTSSSKALLEQIDPVA